MDWKAAIAQGIIGAGSVFVLSTIYLVFRWLWLGIKVDIRLLQDRWHKRKSQTTLGA